MSRKIRTTLIYFLIYFVTICFPIACYSGSFYDDSSPIPKVLSEKTYLSTNLHADRGKGKLSTVNYQILGELIKWGTPVKIIEYYSNDNNTSNPSSSEYKLIDLNTKKEHRFVIYGKTLRHLTADDFFKKITTDDIESLKKKFEKLSDVDKYGINNGVAIEGMSKEGIYFALGAPPIFANQLSLDNSDLWRYWYSRRGEFQVSFDKNGKVNTITGTYPNKRDYRPTKTVAHERMDVEGKLKKLKELYDEKLISHEDYEKKKAEILSKL